jgi:tryptophan 7-halogenase
MKKNDQNLKLTKTVVIVGGGIAGWLTAGRIAAQHKNRVKVVLIESPSIPTVGVGEGTWPTMRSTLIALGIRETDFIRECDASFKQGAKFAKWVDGQEDDFYYHPLVLPQGFKKLFVNKVWLLKLLEPPNMMLLLTMPII